MCNHAIKWFEVQINLILIKLFKKKINLNSINKTEGT